MEQEIINKDEQIRTQKPCPICCEIISEDEEVCPYCDEPTHFHHKHDEDSKYETLNTDHAQPRRKSSSAKNWLVAVGGIVFTLIAMTLLLGKEGDDNTSDLYQNGGYQENITDTMESVESGSETDSQGSQEGEELINDLEDFAISMKDCIEKGVLSTSTAGSHYAEGYSGLLERYEAAENNLNASQQAKVQTLLSTIADLFEEWQAQDNRLMGDEYD